MTIRNREEAAKAAEATHTNTVNACQAVTRGYFNAPSAGDFDGDGAADAEDGWKSEPASAKHFDRNPPRGVPVSWLGGSHDNGHRAISLGNGKIRSTDAPRAGVTSTVDLDWPEKNWGLKYAGWSETIDGQPIPLSPKEVAAQKAADLKKKAAAAAKKAAAALLKKNHKEFSIFLVPGRKVNSVSSILFDMGLVLKKVRGRSAVVFNTERDSQPKREAVLKGLGKGWKRVFDNEATIAYGGNWGQKIQKPTATLLAKEDPSKARVSPNRWADEIVLENATLRGYPIGFLGTHLLSEANCEHVNIRGRAWREKMWPIQLNDCFDRIELLHQKGIPVVFAGDLNTGKFFTGRKVKALLDTRFPGKVTHFHNGGLDHIFLISTDSVLLERVGKEIITDNKSDHDMVSGVVRATVL